jgi:two-component system, OmpR family, sensor histidine kinase BaeS
MGAVFALGLFLIAVGFTTVLSWLFSQGSAPAFVRPPRILLSLVWLFILAALFRRVMGRFGFPLGAMVEAADRVAAGDYTTRAPEYGPRWMRTLARAFNSMTSRLEAQDRQRRHLMADIAHELRTPLAVLQGRLEGMVDGVYPRDEAQLTAVLQETRVLTRLVEDLRTLAHSESGTLTLQKESTDIATLLNDTAASFAADTAARNLSLDVDAPTDLPLVDIDPLRIREVLTNLMANALRHTPERGRVLVTVSADDKTVKMSVSDTGSGISAAELPNIFDRFYKGHGSRGSGLGLTIARNLVIAHGGEIRAESEEGKGTTIFVHLPRRPRQ